MNSETRKSITGENDMNPKRLKQVVQKVRLVWLNACLALFALQSSAAFAALPQVDEPQAQRGKGLFGTAQGYIADASIVIGLVIAGAAFMCVAWYSISVFADVQRGKKTWSDFGAVFVVGVILVVVCIWLLTKAATII